jgi:uncharacterized protein (TIGR02328 family)
MRLWHYKLIPVLPNAMLVSQWRECIAIKRQWEKGTLKHRLVSYVQEYNDNLYLYYVKCVAEEMYLRGIKYQTKFYKEISDFCGRVYLADHYPKHNDRYLKQCLYNLQEKADRGIITQEEWQKIEDKFGGML